MLPVEGEKATLCKQAVLLVITFFYIQIQIIIIIIYTEYRYRSVGVWSKGKEEARTTKEDVEDASGEGEQECWFGVKDDAFESSEIESGSWRDCC